MAEDFARGLPCTSCESVIRAIEASCDTARGEPARDNAIAAVVQAAYAAATALNAVVMAELCPQLFSDVNCIALWISSEKILTRLYSVLHWFHKRLEVNIKNPRENRCFQIVIVFSFGSVDN
jgi:hypothetical protein